MVRNLVSNRRVDNIVKSAVRGTLISYRLKKFQRVLNPPSRKGIDPDISFIKRRHLRWITVPFEKPLFKNIDLLKNRLFEMKTSFFYHSFRLTELRYYNLLCLLDSIKASSSAYQNN
ncbi:hypothetical protein ES703_65318 [subsurface metagenome]